MIRAIIFDLDGVIISTDEYHYLAWKAVADKEGIYFDREINNRLRGVSRMDSLDIILERANKEYSQTEKESLAQEKQNIYRNYLSQLTPKDLSDDAIYTINKLHELGYSLGIGSSSKNTKYILERINLLNAFEFIADGTMISHSKPNPEVFLKAAEGLGLKPSECVVVEDAYSGIDAGNGGGFLTIGIGDAYNYKKADYHIKSLKEIVDIVQQLNK